MPEIAQIFANQNPQPIPSTGRKYKLVRYLTVLVTFTLILSLSLGYLFWWVPQVKAKEFISKTSEVFGEINEKVNLTYQSFADIREESTLAYSSFEEVATPTSDYDYIRKDTDEDIDDIKSLLDSVKDAREQLENLASPESVSTLSSKLEIYYSTLAETAEDLLKHQVLNKKLIDAHGKDLYDAAIKVQNLFNKGGLRTDFVATSLLVSKLAAKSYEKASLITEVDPLEKDYYQVKLDYFKDLEKTFQKASSLYQKGKDKEASDLLIEFTKRNDERNKLVQENSNEYVEKSVAASGFKKLPDLEKEVLEELNLLIEKFGLDIGIIGREATPSAKPNKISTPSATPQENSTPEVSPSTSN